MKSYACMEKIKRIIAVVLAAIVLCSLWQIPAAAASTRRCYTISSGNTPVYSNTGLTRKYGTIFGSDEVTVITVTDRYTKVTYPVSRGRKTGYIRTSAILTGTTGKTYTARAKVTTYRRPGGDTYGYVAAGDKVTVLGSSGSYVQVKYPVSGGYKYGFIRKGDADSYVYGTSGSQSGGSDQATGNRRCYTILNSDTTVYSDTGLTRRYGTIFGSDEITVMTITNTYAKVTYPVSRGTKTGYIPVNAILIGTTGDTYTAKAKITTYRRPGGSPYGYVAVGDRVTVLGRSGNYVQVKYPVSGGYKYGFITKENADDNIYGTGGSPLSPQIPVTAHVSYAPYRGVSYTGQGLSAARVKALDKAKQMVTVQWTAPCDIPTWASRKGIFNRATDINGLSAAKFVQGRTYTGVPYSMTDHSYDDIAWADLLKRGITTDSMTARFQQYPVRGTAKGMDCSYFVYEAIKSAVGSNRIGYQVTSSMMNSRYYKKINRSSMKPGDIFLSSGHVMMYVGRSGSGYAVFEADADDSKCSYNVYSESYIKGYGCYKYTGFSD